MKAPRLTTGDSDTDSAIVIGFLTLLATLTVGSLFYLGSYSLGPEFENRAPTFRATALADGGF